MSTPLPGFRAIQRSALRSKRMRTLSDQAERLYFRLLLATDAYGTMDADPALVKAHAAPGVRSMDEGVIEEAVEELTEAGLLEVWEEDGDSWLHVMDFDQNQLAEFLRKRGRRTSPLPPSRRNASAGAESQNPCKTHNSAPTPAPEVKREEEGVVANAPTPLSDAVPAPATRVAPQKPTRTLEDVERDIATCRTKLGPDIAGMVDDLVLLMACENKTGKLAPTRAHRELWEPITALLDMLKPHDLVAGIKAAITNGAPNATYVKKAAQNAAKRRAPLAPPPAKANARTSEYVVPVS